MHKVVPHLGHPILKDLDTPLAERGNCPKDVPTMRPLPLPPLLPCDFDNDCPEDEKCCLFNHQRTCVSPVPTTPRCPIIPGVMPICGEMCSSDSDCPFGEKCCDNGCGHVCLSHELVKPGSCPIVLFSLRCFDHCRGDSSCSNELKCCPNCLCKVSLFPNENFYKYISGDAPPDIYSHTQTQSHTPSLMLTHAHTTKDLQKCTPDTHSCSPCTPYPLWSRYCCTLGTTITGYQSLTLSAGVLMSRLPSPMLSTATHHPRPQPDGQISLLASSPRKPSNNRGVLGPLVSLRLRQYSESPKKAYVNEQSPQIQCSAFPTQPLHHPQPLVPIQRTNKNNVINILLHQTMLS
nr:uncharacterized protein LOC107373789 [Nothobranchius furzeri]